MNNEYLHDASRSNLADIATLPFKLLEDLDVPCGYERSFKMLDGKLLANRYLLGVNLTDLRQSELIALCRRLEMPEQYLDMLSTHYSNANLAFIGFEDNEPGYVYKIYLEFWDKLIRDMPLKKNKKEPTLLHLGFKWNAVDNANSSISRYTCYPLLTTPEIIARMSSIYAASRDEETFQIVTEILNYAAARAKKNSFIYVEVSEDGSSRNSFDLNLYSASVRLHEIEPYLRRLGDRFGITNEKFAHLYRLVAERLFGHLSGGVSRQRENFLTIYSE